MKFTVSRTSLLHALQTVNSVVPSKPIVPASGCILFTLEEDGKLTVMATDTGVFLLAHLNVEKPLAGSYMIHADLLMKTIKALPECPVELTVTGKDAVIKAGRGSYKLNAEPSEHFLKPHLLGETQTFSIDADVLNQGLSVAIPRTMPDAQTHPALSGIYFDSYDGGVRIVGASNYRMGYLTHKDVNRFPSCILPVEAAKALKGLFVSHDVEVSVGERNISFSNEDLAFIAKHTDAQYPAYMSLIPSPYSYKLVIGRTDLLNALKRMSIYVSPAGTCTYSFSKEELTLTVDNPLVEGKAEESLPCIWDGPDDHKESYLNVEYCIEALNELVSDEIAFNFVSSRHLIEVSGASDENVRLFFMPQAEKVS